MHIVWSGGGNGEDSPGGTGYEERTDLEMLTEGARERGSKSGQGTRAGGRHVLLHAARVGRAGAGQPVAIAREHSVEDVADRQCAGNLEQPAQGRGERAGRQR